MSDLRFNKFTSFCVNFFSSIANGCCINQVVGINTLDRVPFIITLALHLFLLICVFYYIFDNLFRVFIINFYYIINSCKKVQCTVCALFVRQRSGLGYSLCSVKSNILNVKTIMSHVIIKKLSVCTQHICQIKSFLVLSDSINLYGKSIIFVKEVTQSSQNNLNNYL